MITAHGLVFILIISSVKSLRVLEERSEISPSQDSALSKLMGIIITAYRNGRRLNAESLAKAKGMYNRITKDMSKAQIKQWLRNAATEVPPEVQSPSVVMEAQLVEAAKQKKSALFDRPYVEKLGKNDFLVMQPALADPFVTVIPNSIYYNIEKKCVNWLDDCSLRGIRDRLLRGVKSP